MKSDQKETQIRTCIVTREKHKKSDMIRIVSFREEDIKLDLTGKLPGKGCYVSVDKSNLEKLISKNGTLLSRVFKRQIRREELEYLQENFEKVVDEKLFRPRASKPVVYRLKK